MRASALARHRVGAAGARAVASAASLPYEALSLLVGTPFGHEVRVDQSLEEAQHGVAATLLWHLRVLAGWVPRQGTDLVRWSSPSSRSWSCRSRRGDRMAQTGCTVC
jgi:hypothetical protein